MAENSIFEPDGRAVPYVDEGEGPVGLVLIHGIGRTGEALGVIAHYLAEEAGFRVVQIGADAVEDVVAVMDHVGLEDAWIGGHGTGGTLARRVVDAHQERSNGLLLLGVEEEDIPLAPALPVLIIQGADDQVAPPANGDRLQATAPERASVKTLAGADHHFPMTHPIETAYIIEEYLDWD
ncbi:alpha/beta hydrolase [Microbacterium sp. ARD32]|uniref:alpha/beta fold hydrolase n=1 Tax=Microbacterium sp. ARD32 TaxID=2962577 RepID=UPI0028816BFD|nr:alpha/beta hydrolase [Microbacterium sp. ARD32]MDT0156649.1 alpha/beta hydrolase [Microbacterium sp. ARD32]